MKTFVGIVKDGAVELPPEARIREGARVVLAALGDHAEVVQAQALPELVRACRGPVGRQTPTEDG